jgi:sulfite reductase (ferredoxin)
VHDFLEHYLSRKDSYKSYKSYLENEGRPKINALCEKYNTVPDFDVDPSAYIDFGAKKPLSLEEIGTAECSAGMFDMIDVDQKLIRLHQKKLIQATTPEDQQNALFHVLFSASRMLLVTRGLDAKTDDEVFGLFQKHFIESELVNKEYSDIVVLGKLNVMTELPKYTEKINALAEEVINLYKGMDDSLRFKVQTKEAKVEPDKATNAGVDKFMDFRGVGCPMNFVKTKIALSPLKAGQKLQIFLDNGEPIQNVPNSVKLEGHKVLEQKQMAEGHWHVLIEKV